MGVSTLTVIGAGTMGAGICEAAAVAGLTVRSIETMAEQQARAKTRIAQSVQKGIERGKLTAKSPDEVLARISWHGELAAVDGAEFVVEAVSENETIKCDLFAELGRRAAASAILASNTSSISITRLGAVSGRAAQVVGMHFFNPVPIMKPVEVVRGLATSDATVAATEELARALGKAPFVVRDAPGFAVNRVLMPMINEAVFTLEEGIAPAETIDSLMKLGCNHPMGPLELADLVGLDVCLAILDVLYAQFRDPKFRAAPLLRRMVDAGRLGKKAGEGFYRYPR